MQVSDKLTKSLTEAKYLNADNVSRYRCIMRIFFENYEKLKYWLYQEEVYEEMIQDPFFSDYRLEQCQQDLAMLTEWKNLNTIQDTKNVTTIEEFKNKKYRYQMTEYSVEIERLVIRLENLLVENASLEPTLLERIRKNVDLFPEMAGKDKSQVYTWWTDLNNDFVRLNQNYQDYIRDLNSVRAEEMMHTKEFLVFKDRLIEYLRSFIKGLQKNVGVIEENLRLLTDETKTQVFEKVVEYELSIPRMDGEVTKDMIQEKIQGRYESIYNWFVGNDGQENEAGKLFDATNEIIRRITRYAAQLSEKNALGANRKEEYRKVAEIFLRCKDMEEAHKLSAMIFGMERPGHLAGEMIRETDSMNIGVYEEGPMEVTLKPRVRTYREKSKRSSIKESALQKQETRRKLLQKQKEEIEKLRALEVDGKICFDRLPVLEPRIREIPLKWLSDAMESLYRWNGENRQLILEKDLLRELSEFAESYQETSDFAMVRQKISEVWIKKNTDIESKLSTNQTEKESAQKELEEVQRDLSEWENQKEPKPDRAEAVLRNRKRLDEHKIPYQEFYKVIEFGDSLSEEACNRLEEALLKMGILDALIIDEQYKEQVLKFEEGCEDRYLFVCSSGQKNLHPEVSLLDVLELNEEVNDIFSNQRLTGILGSIAYDRESMMTVGADGTYQMGVLAGTITGDYEAGFLGTKAREKQRQAKIKECRQKIQDLENYLQQLNEVYEELSAKKEILKQEYETLPKDTDMREALGMMRAQEVAWEQVQAESHKLEKQIKDLSDKLKEMKKQVLEIAESLYLTCSYEAFKKAKDAAEEYGKHLISLMASHEMFLRSLEYLKERRDHLEDLEADLDQIRYDLQEIQKEIRKKTEELNSIREQLRLTDYEEIKDRLDTCLQWLGAYPERLRVCVSQQTHEEDEVGHLMLDLENSRKKMEEYDQKRTYFSECYEQEWNLHYVEIPETIPEDARHIRSYLESDVKTVDKDSLIRDLNKVYFENRGFLTDYHLTQNELFTEVEHAEFPAKRLDISARYQGVKISFSSLLTHLTEDIEELENLIKDGDRELFEDILANTVSRKIRGKINSSNTWVQKMNTLMNSMNTSSGLRLSLRWRSKTAEQEDQLDTKELVELLKKDYRLMNEEEAARLSAHFRSKVAEARRNARDSAGMVSFYQIMKETLDYRKWFEFQLFSQKNGERQKELTNSVFGTFSGGEKAMSMYVPLFSAVVAKYQGGRQDAPRLISLDEAFAGVDNKNIRDMFRLMTEFEFDFIINSQVLWGDCDTLDALAIYQLIRPENAKFVTVMSYLWNGNKKELLEEEEEVEQRGREIEQAAGI